MIKTQCFVKNYIYVFSLLFSNNFNIFCDKFWNDCYIYSNVKISTTEHWRNVRAIRTRRYITTNNIRTSRVTLQNILCCGNFVCPLYLVVKRLQQRFTSSNRYAFLKLVRSSPESSKINRWQMIATSNIFYRICQI